MCITTNSNLFIKTNRPDLNCRSAENRQCDNDETMGVLSLSNQQSRKATWQVSPFLLLDQKQRAPLGSQSTRGQLFQSEAALRRLARGVLAAVRVRRTSTVDGKRLAQGIPTTPATQLARMEQAAASLPNSTNAPPHQSSL